MAKAERDYSHRSLMQKLGVRPEHRVYGRNLDASFVRALRDEIDAPLARALRGKFDLIFFTADSPADLAAIEVLATHLEPNGGLWIFHPKGGGASPSDAEVRGAGIGSGLVDNKICAYTATHTATRYVIPRNKR